MLFSYGGVLVDIILVDEVFNNEWVSEVNDMCECMKMLCVMLVKNFYENGLLKDFSFVND